jgi:hypothetical protein
VAATNPTYERYKIEQEAADKESTRNAILGLSGDVGELKTRFDKAIERFDAAIERVDMRLDAVIPVLRVGNAAALVLSIVTFLLVLVLLVLVLLVAL